MYTTRQLVFLVLCAAATAAVWFAIDHRSTPRIASTVAKKEVKRPITGFVYCARISSTGLYLGGSSILKIPFPEEGASSDSEFGALATQLMDTARSPIMHFIDSPAPDQDRWAASPDYEGYTSTWVYSDDFLVCGIPCLDVAQVQFSMDGKYLVSASYNMLSVFDCDSFKVIDQRQFGGEDFFSGFDVNLAPNTNGRKAFINASPAYWWDPVSKKKLGSATAAEKPSGWKYALEPMGEFEVSRGTAKLFFNVTERKTRRPLGKILPRKGYKTVPQWYSFIGGSGFAIPYDNMMELYSLKDAKLIAQVYPFLGHIEEYAIVLADGTYMGTPGCLKYITVPVGKLDTPRVIRELLTKCGVKAPA